MATRAQLVGALLDFPAIERAEAARALLESLEPESNEDPVDVEAAWRGEIAVRVQEIESGAIELVDGPAAMAEMHRRAQARFDRRRR